MLSFMNGWQCTYLTQLLKIKTMPSTHKSPVMLARQLYTPCGKNLQSLANSTHLELSTEHHLTTQGLSQVLNSFSPHKKLLMLVLSPLYTRNGASETTKTLVTVIAKNDNKKTTTVF